MTPFSFRRGQTEKCQEIDVQHRLGANQKNPVATRLRDPGSKQDSVSHQVQCGLGCSKLLRGWKRTTRDTHQGLVIVVGHEVIILAHNGDTGGALPGPRRQGVAVPRRLPRERRQAPGAPARCTAGQHRRDVGADAEAGAGAHVPGGGGGHRPDPVPELPEP